MKAKRLLIPAYFLALVYISGRTAIQVSGGVQAGRNALHASRPGDAAGYFFRAANVDPAYKFLTALR